MAGSRPRVGLPSSVQRRYRELAESGNCLLKDLHAKAVLRFVETRQAGPAGADSARYLVAPRNALNQNVDLPDTLQTRVRSLAKRDKVSARTFLYSALVSYIDAESPER